MIDAVVVGADSHIGSALFCSLSGKCNVVGTSRRFNSNFHRFELLYEGRKLPPAAVTYFCAAITGFKICDADPEFARTVNVHRTVESAASQVERGGRVVYMSSAAAETHLDRTYGQLKLEVERGFLKFGDSAAIVRCGPVNGLGRFTYPDGPYHPIDLAHLVKYLGDLMTDWQPGIHRLLNESSVPTIQARAQAAHSACISHSAPRQWAVS